MADTPTTADPRHTRGDVGPGSDRLADGTSSDDFARVERQSAEVELARDETPADPDSTLDPDDATVRDWAVANDARPDMIGETEDGLDDTEEAVRRAADGE